MEKYTADSEWETNLTSVDPSGLFLPMNSIKLIISEAENLPISLENHPGLYPVFRKSLPFIVSGTAPKRFSFFFLHGLKCS